MSDNIKKLPQIRFVGFTDSWKQDELGEVTEVYDGTHQTPEYKAEGIMFLSVENIKTLQSEKYISEEAFESEFKVRPQRGDVMMTRIGDVGTANVITSTEPIAYYVSLALLKKKDLNPYFLQASIHSSTVQNEIWKRTLHIAFPKKINKNEIEKIPINYPINQEQDKIGLFFNELDKLITLHQHKLELLKDKKKSLLQKMFPKDGANVPEIRFAGFNDAWEERKLDTILKERKVKQKISKEAPLLAFASGQGVIDKKYRKTNNRDFLTKDSSKKTYLLTKYDDIVYNPSNLKYGAIDRNKHGTGVISPIYITFETDEIPSFIELIVKSENFKQRALQYEEGTVTKRQSVKPENLLSLNVLLPIYRDEQLEIGKFFEQLDNTIDLCQDELNSFGKLKKSLLQQMFV